MGVSLWRVFDIHTWGRPRVKIHWSELLLPSIRIIPKNWTQVRFYFSIFVFLFFFIVTDKYVDIQKSRQIVCSVYKNASLEYKNIKIISYKFWFIWILKYIKTIKIIKQIIRADLMNISFGVFWLLIHKNLLNPDFTSRSNCYSWELKQKKALCHMMKTARTEFLMRPLKEFWLRLVLQLSLVENHSVVFV